MSIQALAAPTGSNAGGTYGPGHDYSGTPYGFFKSGDDFAWRVNLYVSANEDGKIDESKDTIGSTSLPLVGSILCISKEYISKNGNNYPTFIQTNYTDTCRNSFDKVGASSGTGEDLGMVQYTLPTLKEFEPSFPSYHASGANHFFMIKSR